MTIDRIGGGVGPDFIQDLTEAKASDVQGKAPVNQAGGASQVDSFQLGTAASPMNLLSFVMLNAMISNPNVHHIPDVGKMPWLDQGSANACGTTSLAMILSYLTGQPFSKDQIDSAIRRWDTFTAPNDLIDYARSHGVEAEGYNHGSWGDVKNMIDQGYPVEAVINADYSYPDGGSVSGLHYIAITGYETDPATGQEYVLFHDPNLGDDPATAANEGQEMRLPVSEFEKMWGDVGFGFDNYYMAFGPPGANLPPGNDDGLEGVMGTLEGITNITNGLSRIFEPDSFGGFVHGLFEFPAGIVQTVGCGIGGGISLAGQWLNDVTEGIPVVENLVQPLGDIVNGVGAAVGDFVNGIGEGVDSFGGAFESLFDGDIEGFGSGLWDGITDIGGGIVDAVGDVVSGIGDAVSDFFSGW